MGKEFGQKPAGAPAAAPAAKAPQKKDEMLDKPLPGAEEMAKEEEGGSEVEAKQEAEEKLGAIIQDTGKQLESLVAVGIIEEGDDTFKALAAIMANAQVALDSLSNDMPAELSSEPEVVTPAGGEAPPAA